MSEIDDGFIRIGFDVKLAIPDPDFGGRGILFANTHRDKENRYLVSRLQVE